MKRRKRKRQAVGHKKDKDNVFLEILSWAPELIILPFRLLLMCGRAVIRFISHW